ncbi:MAG TPA: PadR family transcriptional regulator [Clostridia bacterium]|nr:PadR family transcriptional regulator [Clostridia bacterium]
MDGQMKKGILEMCILFQLSKKEMYGYEIMKLIKEAFPDVHEATIYTILRRLNINKHTETYYGETSNGPPRKYYKISSLGFNTLKDSIQEWDSMVDVVRMLGIK